MAKATKNVPAQRTLGFKTEGLFGEPTGAIFSQEHRRYRYLLWRRWADGPYCMFVGLNPSTADETQNDPTIRRCIAFCQRWGFGAYVMANLYGERSPNPDWIIEVMSNSDPVGPENDEWLRRAAAGAGRLIVAWGCHKGVTHRDRDNTVLGIFDQSFKGVVECLKLTKAGFPQHPLYVKGDTEPQIYLGRN